FRILCLSILFAVAHSAVAHVALKAPSLLDDPDSEKGFVPLFGDSSTRMIIGEKANRWAFNEDGSFVSRGPGSSWLLTKKEYSDFELRLEIKLSENADTGITFRATQENGASARKSQIQFIDEKVSELLPPNYRTGGLWDIVGPMKED